MEFLNSIGKSIETANKVLAPVGEWLQNKEKLNEYMEVLTRKVDRLSSRAEDINTELETLESQSGKKRKREVQNWLTNVQRMENEVQQIRKEVQENSYLSQACLRRRVEKNVREAAELVEQGRFPEGLVLMYANFLKGEELISVPLVGETTAKRKLEKIWGHLMNEETSSIGVYGMGGVGKTTIVTHVHNRLLKYDQSFGHVYWVTVSHKSSINKLQNDIAKAVGQLDLSGEEDELKRAARLFQRLMRCTKFVLILDDMWERFPAEKVGIPLGVNGGKLLLTTRSLKVCREMGCEEIVKLEPLSKEDSWNLFLNKLGHVLAPYTEDIAKSMVEECDGLPLAIVVVARSMRGVEEISDWRNALYELKDPAKGLNHDFENEVFKSLKFSYDRLEDERLRQCLLYFSLFPEDCHIRRHDLIEYWIGEGLIEDMGSMLEEFDRGNAIINRLIDACLLENAGIIDACLLENAGIIDACLREYAGANYVKMHDVIRDMFLTITRANSMFMMTASEQLGNFSIARESLCNLDCVSLKGNYLYGCLPPNISPNCPKLKTFILQYNCSIGLPNCFFVNMKSLTALELSNLGIEWLPDSISNLGKLRVLLIKYCIKLRHIPSLAKLENLQELDLCYTGVEELPNGLERLVNLRVLDLSHTSIKGLITSAMLQKLSRLQSLRLLGCNAEVQPAALIRLGKLESLQVKFSDIHKFNSFVRTQHLKRLREYFIPVGLGIPALFRLDNLARSSSGRSVLINRQKDPIFLPDNVEQLDIENCNNGTSLLDHLADGKNCENLEKCDADFCKGMESIWSTPYIKNFPIFANLQELNIIRCRQLKHLFTSSLAQHLLQNLVKLQVCRCCELEEIIAPEEQSFNKSSSHNNTTTIVLPKLQHLTLEILPKLKSIYRGTMVCHSLEIIAVRHSQMLKKLPFSMQQPGEQTSLMKIYGEKKWWDSLEWDHPIAKSTLQPFYGSHTGDSSSQSNCSAAVQLPGTKKNADNNSSFKPAPNQAWTKGRAAYWWIAKDIYKHQQLQLTMAYVD